MAAWIRTDAVPWLVTGRPEPEPVVGGVTFGAGFLHQPVEWLVARWRTFAGHRIPHRLHHLGEGRWLDRAGHQRTLATPGIDRSEPE
jgi:hypothetical protein